MNTQEIMQLIRRISREEGVDAEYMLKTANIESQYDPNATNPRSSAAGLFQILPMHGVGDVYNPDVNTRWAARFTLDNKRFLHINGIPISHETLYLAHQQGREGAKTIWNAMETDKNINNLPPNIARNVNANNPRQYTSVRDWYEFWASKMRQTSSEPRNTQAPIAVRQGSTNTGNSTGNSTNRNMGIMLPTSTELDRQRAEEERRRARQAYNEGDDNEQGGYGNNYASQPVQQAGSSDAGAWLLGAAAAGGLLLWLLSGDDEKKQRSQHVFTIEVEEEEEHHAQAA